MTLNWGESPEEKKARIDRILEKNSQKPLVCVSCLEILSLIHI